MYLPHILFNLSSKEKDLDFFPLVCTKKKKVLMNNFFMFL